MRQPRPPRIPCIRNYCGNSGCRPLLLPRPSVVSRRAISSTRARQKSSQALPPEQLQAEYNRFFQHDSAKRFSPDVEKYGPDEPVTIHGFIGKRVKGGDDSLTLVGMTTTEGYEIQLASTSKDMLDQVRAVTPFSPVRVTGTVRIKSSSPPPAPTSGPFSKPWSLQLQTLHALNAFPPGIIISPGVRFGPEQRHLQLRFEGANMTRLEFRSRLKAALGAAASDIGYTDVDTPLLFKSTPEGAREFLVPVRGKPGRAYALPQSPQQYKQVLMAAGVDRYVQFARCFRDEDLRADRQPEFTQMDLERAFARGEDVMADVEQMLLRSWEQILQNFDLARNEDDGSWTPVSKKVSRPKTHPLPSLPGTFPRMRYQDCITQYGSDKPDLRIAHPIFRFPSNKPIREFLNKTSSAPDPIMEACAIRLRGDASPREVRDAVSVFMDTLGPAHTSNPHGLPQVVVADSSLPLRGFSSLGHEGYEALATGPAAEASGLHDLKDGDVVLFQCRDNSPPGASTRIGELRPRLWNHLMPLLDTPETPQLCFLWVTDFPMFTPDDPSIPTHGHDRGRGGGSGFSSTHHPFTAPRSPGDFALLFTDPLSATAEHYDLVLNGVEVGGGSRRIHVAEIQEFVMRDVLRLPPERLAQFSHLLDALRAGCPPHSGFALGFDRLCAVLSGTPSVRDVIAFPKSKKGEDLFAKAPGRVTESDLAVYHLRISRAGGDEEQ